MNSFQTSCSSWMNRSVFKSSCIAKYQDRPVFHDQQSKKSLVCSRFRTFRNPDALYQKARLPVKKQTKTNRNKADLRLTNAPHHFIFTFRQKLGDSKVFTDIYKVD